MDVYRISCDHHSNRQIIDQIIFISNALLFQSSSNGVTVGTPNTATITILSNDNAFGIISFNSVSFFLHYFLNEQREEAVQSVLGRGDCKPELFSLILWGGN